MLKIIIKPQLKKVWYWYMNIQYKKIKDQKKKKKTNISKSSVYNYKAHFALLPAVVSDTD